MQIPCYELLRKNRQDYLASGSGEAVRSYARGVHPNPHFFKYYWWIFWIKSPADGTAFLSDRYRLSTAAAMRLLQALSEMKEPCWIYNQGFPRAGLGTPFDLKHPRWIGAEIASNYEDDRDPIAEGMLAGHR